MILSLVQTFTFFCFVFLTEFFPHGGTEKICNHVRKRKRKDRHVKDKTVIALVSHETRIKTAALWSSSHKDVRVSRECLLALQTLVQAEQKRIKIEVWTQTHILKRWEEATGAGAASSQGESPLYILQARLKNILSLNNPEVLFPQ